MVEQPGPQRSWPLLALVGLSSTLLVLFAVVLSRGIQQGRTIERLHQRLSALEGGTTARGSDLLDGQLKQLSERLQRLEALAARVGGGQGLQPDLPPIPDPLPPELPPPGLAPSAPADPGPARDRWDRERPAGERPRSGAAPLRPPRPGPAAGSVLTPPGF